MFSVGDTVIDRATKQPAEVEEVCNVPPLADLFGAPLPAHTRLTLRYASGEFATRTLADVEPIPA